MQEYRFPSVPFEFRAAALGHGRDAFPEVVAGAQAVLLGELVLGDAGDLLGETGAQGGTYRLNREWRGPDTAGPPATISSCS